MDGALAEGDCKSPLGTPGMTCMIYWERFLKRIFRLLPWLAISFSLVMKFVGLSCLSAVMRISCRYGTGLLMTKPPKIASGINPCPFHQKPSNPRIRDVMKKVLMLPPQTVLEYKAHDQSMKDNSSFRNTDKTKL